MQHDTQAGAGAGECDELRAEVSALWVEIESLRGELERLTDTLARVIRSETIRAAVADGYAPMRTDRDEDTCERLDEDRARLVADSGALA